MIKVIDNSRTGTRFNCLSTGTTFKHIDRYYIKVSLITDQMESYNAVDLSDGEFECFNDSDLVFPFNCELIVL